MRSILPHLGRDLARFCVLWVLAFGPVLPLGVTVAQEQPAVVKVDKVVSEPLAQTVPVLGRIVARQQGEVAAEVGGLVAFVPIEVGDRVEADQMIANLDSQRLELERDLARAELQAAQEEVTAAESNVMLLEQGRARLSRLEDSAAFNRAELDDLIIEVGAARAEVAAAKARVERARANLGARERDLEDAVLRAPYPGVVVQRHVSAGAYLDLGEPVIELVNDTAVEIEADVPANRVGYLQPGMEITYTHEDGSEHVATVRAVIPVENPMTRTRAVRFVPSNGGNQAAEAVNQSVTVEVPIGQPRDVTTVHKDAVTISQGRRMVFVVGEDDTAQPRNVELGRAVGNRFEVLSGLETGTTVVVRGNERLRPGQKVAYGSGPSGDGDASG